MPSPDIDLGLLYGPEHAPVTEAEKAQGESLRKLMEEGRSSAANGSTDDSVLEEEVASAWFQGEATQDHLQTFPVERS